MKKIAFIITVYNNDKPEFFKQAIESIVNQDYGFQNINIYLGIDGDLPDDITNYIDSNKDFFYKIVQNEENKGLAYTLNRLIESLEAEIYIFRMDSDDISRNDRVTKTIEKLESDKELKLLGSDMVDIDANGQELRYKAMPVEMKDIINYATTRNPLNHPTVAIKRDFFDIVGTYDESIMKSQDYELWARALKKGVKCTNISEPLLFFRTTDSFLKKRNSSINYISELKISIGLMIHFHKYSQLPKIIIKFLIRLMPEYFGRLVYNLIRE